MFHHWWLSGLLAPVGLVGLLVCGIHEYCSKPSYKSRVQKAMQDGMCMRANGKIYWPNGTVTDAKPVQKK